MNVIQRIGQECKAIYTALTTKQDILAEGAFLDGDKTKLDGIETAATADQTGAEIKALYEAELDTNAYTDLEKSKLAGIEDNATQDQTDAEISLLMKDYAETLTNKTIKDNSNEIHADIVHYEVQATEAIAQFDVLVATGVTDDTTVKVGKRSSYNQPVIGIAEEAITNGALGSAFSFGVIPNISNTGAFSVGDIIYANATGGFTTTPLIADGNYNQPIGYVIKSNPANFTMMINIASGHEPSSLISHGASNVGATLDTFATDIAGKLDLTGGAMTGPITTNSTVDGRDLSVDGAKLDGIEVNAKDDQLSSEVPFTPVGNIIATDVQAAIAEVDSEKQAISEKGQINGYASLDGSGLIPSSQLPSYVDDVIEVATYAALPVTGTTGFIYIVVADETSGGNTSTYRWTGTVYAQVSDTMSAADIKSLYESNANTNAFTDAEQTKLAGIESGATADQVWGEITGTLSNQTDLQSALDGKASLDSGVSFNTITPTTTSLYDLGSTLLKFNNAYINNVITDSLTTEGASIALNDSIVPSLNAAYSIGSSTNNINFLYTAKAYITTLYSLSPSGMYCDTTLRPAAGRDLGTATQKWANAYLTNALADTISLGGTDLQTTLDSKQDNLTFDTVPTDASTNPVESNGVFDALATKAGLADANIFTANQNVVTNDWPTVEIKSTLGTTDPNVYLVDSFNDQTWRIHNDVSSSNNFSLSNINGASSYPALGFAHTTGNGTLYGYTKLGSTAPAIKTIKLTGTTGAAQGDSVNIAHGVVYSKILGYDILVDTGSVKVPENFSINGGYEYGSYAGTTAFTVKTHATNSTNILSANIIIHLTYEE